MRNLTMVVLLVLVAASAVSFGAILGESVMLYPNIFRDPPESLTLAREFIVAGSPSDFFPAIGMSIIASGLAAVAFTWRTPRVRWWFVAATAVYVCFELLFSAWFFWPRNEIMFVDPVGTHPADYLRTVAAEFHRAHWVRVIGGGVAAALAFTGFLGWYRRWLREPAGPVAGAPAA